MATTQDDFNDLDDNDLQGRSFPEPGQYLVMISNIDEAPKFGDVELELTVCAGTVEKQAGKKLHVNWTMDCSADKDGGKFRRSVRLRLLLAAGIFSSLEDAKAKNCQYEIPSLMYRCFKCAIGHREYTTKSGGKGVNAEITGRDMWAPNDPEAAHIPVDPETLTLCCENGQTNAVMPSAAGAAQPKAQATQTATTNATAPAASKPVDKYAGL